MRQTQKYALGQFSNLSTKLLEEMTEVQKKLRRTQIQLRAFMNEGSPNLEQKAKVEDQARNLQTRIDDLKENLMGLGVERGAVEQALQTANLGVTAAVGIPALVGLSYANDAWRQN